MVNTFDYPVYGLAVEKVRIAFRLAYSILDKVAYFLNDYLRLGIPEKRVSFRGLWYDRQQPDRGLRADIHRPDNDPLRGLFWLAKDLYEKDAGFVEVLEPSAREVAEIRNHLEHKYLKLHHYSVPQPSSRGIGFETLAFSLERTEFERRALWLLRTSRVALLHISMAMHIEEAGRRRGSEDGFSLPIEMDRYEDEWKM